MKKAFTLIELLIVIAVMATLTTIMFRIGAVSEDETERITSITRLQKLENCLSGYFSAFGSYPPVKVHGSRDIYAEVEYNVQSRTKSNDRLVWSQIQAACRSQPVDCAFPFDEDMEEEVKDYSDRLKEIAGHNSKFAANPGINAGFDIGDPGEFTGELWKKKTDWRDVQIFKFGLVSYLLPRYLVMMLGDAQYYGAKDGDPCAQWSASNDNCVDALTGDTLSWKETFINVERDDDGKLMRSKKDYMRVANMPTQAVCANWIANLEQICRVGHNISDIFGVDIREPGYDIFSDPDEDEDEGPPSINLYTPGGKGGDWYMLDTITVVDGWGQTFYYYSPAGAQSYVLWSSGKDCRTFPPWIDKTGLMDETVDDDGYSNSPATISKYISDDIIRMNH